ncbi:MAG: hypothetical protein HUJ27_15465 [Rhodobacteraceae bacterium]|nr:hypothetical protein [Paracoccaceae bacterium]
MNVARLRVFEQVRLDRDRLATLYREIGERGTENLIEEAMEQIATQLSNIRKAMNERKLADVHRSAKNVRILAEQIGMPLLASVASDVMQVCRNADRTALYATVARLTRIGENSLIAAWGLEDRIV